MEKRFVSFVVFAVLLMVGYQFILTKFIFKPAPPVVADAGDKQPPEKIEEHPLPPQEDQRPTLGSLDPNSPYKLLVTLGSRGGSVERVELNNPKFREMHDVSDPQRLHGGYLANLDLKPQPDGGGLIRVVGPGTPAALAGFQVGDVLTALDGEPIVDDFSQRRYLANKAGGQVVEATLLRGKETIKKQATLLTPPLQIIQPETSPPPGLTVEALNDWKEYESLSFLLTFEQYGDYTLKMQEKELPGFKLHQQHWKVVPGADPMREVSMVAAPEGTGLEITKKFRLEEVVSNSAKPEENRVGYALRVSVEVKNTGSAAKKFAYRLDGPKGLPTEGYWYPYKLAGHGQRDVVVGFDHQPDPSFLGAQEVTKQASERKDPQRWVDTEQKPIRFAGVDTPFFASVMMPEPQAGKNPVQWVQSLCVNAPRTDNPYLTNSSVQVGSREIQLDAGQSHTDAYNVFIGPKAHYHILPAYKLESLIQYGWFPWIVQPLMYFLDFLYGLIGNYGVAIIVLTVIVRLVLLPFTRRIAYSMQVFQVKMQKVKPELDRLNEKYKDNPTEKLRVQQEIFRKHDINPGVMAGGCLGAFAQLPIFVGLLNALRIDIELRQAPLFSSSWNFCGNLAAPDMLWYWEPLLPQFLSGPNGWFGPYLNLLPVISTCLFLWHQHRSMPPAQDEQQAAQHTMMQIMTVVFTVFFFRVPCGLCLYFITSTLWGIMERATLPKIDPATVPDGPVVKPKSQPADLEENSAVKMVSQWLAGKPEGTSETPAGEADGPKSASDRRKERKKKERDRR